MKAFLSTLCIFSFLIVNAQLPPPTGIAIGGISDTILNESIVINKKDSLGLFQGIWIVQSKLDSTKFVFAFFQNDTAINYADFRFNELYITNQINSDSSSISYQYRLYKELNTTFYLETKETELYSGRFKNGLKRGTWTYTNRETGNITREEKYKKGELIKVEKK